MTKKTALLLLIAAVLILSSCTVQIADRPDYYADYDDSYYYTGTYTTNPTGHYSAYAVVPTVVPTPAPSPVVIINYITLKVVDNTYYFFEGDKEIALWKFRTDGSVVKKGRIISGLVKRFYDGTNIPESEFNYRNGERHGVCKKYYPNGLLKEQMGFKDGERHGAFVSYYANGRPAEEGEFDTGKRKGFYKKFLETGDLMERGRYDRDKVIVLYSNRPAAAATEVYVGHTGRGNTPTPVPTLVPTSVPQLYITVVVTATPVPVNTPMPVITILQERVITVVVTATPVTAVTPAAAVTVLPGQVITVVVTATETDDRGHHDNGKHLGWEKQEDKALDKDGKEIRKDEKTEIKDEIKSGPGKKYGKKPVIAVSPEAAATATPETGSKTDSRGKSGKPVFKAR